MSSLFYMQQCLFRFAIWSDVIALEGAPSWLSVTQVQSSKPYLTIKGVCLCACMRVRSLVKSSPHLTCSLMLYGEKFKLHDWKSTPPNSTPIRRGGGVFVGDLGSGKGFGGGRGWYMETPPPPSSSLRRARIIVLSTDTSQTSETVPAT